MSNTADLPDWSDPEILSAPHTGYRTLLDNARVSFSEAVGGWLVVGHDDVTALLLDERLSAAGPQSFMAMLPPEAQAELTPLREFFAHWMVFADDPYHSAVKGRLIKPWSARSVQEWQPMVRRAVGEQFAALGGETVDAVSGLARPLSNRIICEILGVPARDRAMVDRWSADIIGFIVTPQPEWERGRQAQAAVTCLRPYAWELAHRPGHMLAPLTPLGEVAVAATLAQLLTGGIDPLAAAVASLLHAVLAGDWPAREDQDRGAVRHGVEESLRLSCPFTLAPRVTRQDMRLDARKVPAGEMVNLVLAAANRDPHAYADPDTFRAGRRGEAQQLAFGVGPHYCLGANLARVVLAEVAEYATGPGAGFQPAGDATWLPAFGIRTLISLPMRRVHRPPLRAGDSAPYGA